MSIQSFALLIKKVKIYAACAKDYAQDIFGEKAESKEMHCRKYNWLIFTLKINGFLDFKSLDYYLNYEYPQ